MWLPLKRGQRKLKGFFFNEADKTVRGFGPARHNERWRGFWIGGQDLAFNHKVNPQRFAFLKAWVPLENIANLMQVAE
jgi:hypothetical protein